MPKKRMSWDQFISSEKVGELLAGAKDIVFNLAKEEGRKVEDLELCRVDHAQKAKVPSEDLEAGSRAAIKYVSARTRDRDDEVIVPKGLNVKEFMKYAHVLFGHNYNLPILGADEWVVADDFGLKAKTVYGDTGEGTLADIQWRLVKQGLHKASSIGFVPLAWTEPGHNDWDRVGNKLESEWPEFVKEGTARVITKGVLLEHSDVTVPANVDAEMIAVAKGAGATDGILKMMGLNSAPGNNKGGGGDDEPADEKRVIPFSVHGDGPKSDKGASWDGPRQVAAADVAELRIMCAWYDQEAADIKSSYKLPHHLAAGEHSVVWRGVTAAMAALLGARGGVDIPASDRKGVYNHLARHYRQFDEEPPELRSYTQGELRKSFPDLYEPVVVIQRVVKEVPRVVKEVRAPIDVEQLVSDAVKNVIDRKCGKL